MGGPLFVAVFLVEGARRDGYDPIRQPVSSLALGKRGWIQRVNFIATGLLMLACSRGLRRASRRRSGSTWVARLVGTYAVGLIGAGVFVTDPVSGYDPGPARAPGSGPHVLHDAFSLVVFGALAGATLVEAGRSARSGDIGWAAWSASTGTLLLAGVGLFGRGFAEANEVVESPDAGVGPRGLARVAGLIQRATISIGWGWLSMLALRAIRRVTDPKG